MKITRRILCVALAIISILMLCIVAGVVCDKKAQSEIKEKEYRVVFNNCYAYERLNTEYISSEHNREACFFTKENPEGTFVEVEGYKHIHYAVFNEVDELFCAAISDDGKRFLLKLNEQNEVVSKIEVETLPIKLYVYKDLVVAYYIGHEAASLYSVDFTSETLNLITDDVTVFNSYGYQKYLNGDLELEEYYLYDCYQETGDLGYTFFDYNCVDEVFVFDEKILYKSKTAENLNQWTLLKNGEREIFENKDVCLGFADNNTLLFYKQFIAGFFRCYGVIYRYNLENGDKNQYRITVNKGILKPEIINDGEYVAYAEHDFGGSTVYFMDTQNGVDTARFSYYEFQEY